MDTSVVVLHVATGDTKVTEAVPVYSYSSPFCQPHSLTLALYIYRLQKVIKLTRSLKIKVQYSQACSVKAITEWDEAEWWIFDFAGSLWGPGKRWAEVTAANHQSKFALIVFISRVTLLWLIDCRCYSWAPATQFILRSKLASTTSSSESPWKRLFRGRLSDHDLWISIWAHCLL